MTLFTIDLGRSPSFQSKHRIRGNRVKKSKGASLETWEFGYDVTNRLIAVSKRATDGGTLQLRVDYKYDALGRRIERYEDTNGDGNTDVRERFGYDGEHVWADLDGSNNLTYRRIFGEGIDTPEVCVSAGGVVGAREEINAEYAEGAEDGLGVFRVSLGKRLAAPRSQAPLGNVPDRSSASRWVRS